MERNKGSFFHTALAVTKKMDDRKSHLLRNLPFEEMKKQINEQNKKAHQFCQGICQGVIKWDPFFDGFQIVSVNFL